MEKKIIWERPVCMTVTQQELDERVTVASCSRWMACPLRYPMETPNVPQE